MIAGASCDERTVSATTTILPARAILPARPVLPAQPIRPTRAGRGSGVIQGAFLGGKPRLTMTAGRSGSATLQRSAAMPTSNATPLPPEFGGFRPVMPAQRMPEAIQLKRKSLFKTSFSDVRIHVGPDAGLIGASAFTQGSDVFFAPGQYNPEHARRPAAIRPAARPRRPAAHRPGPQPVRLGRGCGERPHAQGRGRDDGCAGGHASGCPDEGPG